MLCIGTAPARPSTAVWAGSGDSTILFVLGWIVLFQVMVRLMSKTMPYHDKVWVASIPYDGSRLSPPSLDAVAGSVVLREGLMPMGLGGIK